MGDEIAYCDIGLRMQSTESFPNKSMIVMPHLPSYSTTYYYTNNNNTSSSSSSNNITNSYYISSSPYCCESMSNDGTSTGAVEGDNISYNNNHVSCLSDLYDVVGAAGSVPLQRTFIPLTNTSDFSPKSSAGGGMVGNSSSKGRGFTLRQWEELERQIMICKYMMASVPVPSHLLLTLSHTSTFPSTVSTSLSNQYNTSCRLDARYTRGGNNNDAEPWRCRRTDGKKWRCSRDVAPYLKYCERHAHKPRPRSRKPVENTNRNTNISSIKNNNLIPPQALQKQVCNIPAVISGATYAQPRCTEWFMKGDSIPGSALNDQWQQLVQPSPKGLKLYDEHGGHGSVFQKHYEEEKGMAHANTYLCTNDDSSFQNRLGPNHQAQTTRHFIDAWSCPDEEVEIGHISNQTPLSLGEKFHVSSLTLSMPGGTGDDDGNENGKGFKTDWLNSDTYTCVPPGGPLGEALCLGISSTGKGHLNLPSPHGYSNSNSTTTSSCSKSSCEDNSHGLHFR